MRIEEGKTCKVFNRILLALKYLRQATWRQRVSRYLLQRLIRVCYKMLLFYILHSHSKAKYDQSCLEMIRCLLFLQVKATKAGTSGKVVQFLHTVGVWPCSYGHLGHQGRLKWVPGL